MMNSCLQPHRVRVYVLVFCYVLLGGTCRLVAEEPRPLPTDPGGQAHLRGVNATLQTSIIDRVGDLLVEVETGGGRGRDRRSVRKWTDFVVRETAVALEDKEPLAGLLDLWAVCVQMDDYIQTGEGKTRFGVYLPAMRQAMSDIRDHVRDTVGGILEPSAFETAGREIEVYASQNILDYDSGLLSRLFDLRDVPFSVVKTGQSTLKSVASVPLIPMRAGQGIRRGTDELRDFNQIAGRFTGVVEELPARSRKEVELLLEKINDESSTLTTLAGSLEQSSRNAATAMESAERLSPEVREIVGGIDESAATLDRTARSIELAAREIRLLVEEVERLRDAPSTGSAETAASKPEPGPGPEAYADAAAVIGEAAAEINVLLDQLQELREPSEKPEQAEEGRPFDVREYTEAAAAMETASREIRGILDDLRSAAGDEVIDRSSKNLLNRAEVTADRIGARIESLIDHLLIRTALFLTFVAGLTIVYRRIRGT